MRERVLASRTIFEGRILRLRVDDVEAADGHRSTREVIEHEGAVGVVCVHDGEVWLVRQYRHATAEVLLEIPAGKLGKGEDPEACAARELVEEIGLRPRRLEHLATYYTTPGFTNERFYLYFTDDVVPESGSTDEGEVIEIERRPASSARELLSSGEIGDAKTLLGLAFLALRS
ncbi:MAG TPA: NUDIX hydrolase [Actinomycetota bacterium]|jgi:ADP-ribose pyrophosphatase|nr:NUDIX hydrolase [Actinomycetota bacterium]